MSSQYYIVRDFFTSYLSRGFKTRFENRIRQSEYMSSAFGSTGKPRKVVLEPPENKRAFEEEYLSLVNNIILSLRDETICQVLEPYELEEPYRVNKRLSKYKGWSSSTLACLKMIFTTLAADKKFLLTKQDFIKFLDLMGERSSDVERGLRISQLMQYNDDINLDQFFDMVYSYSEVKDSNLGELAYRVFIYSVKQDCMNKGDVSEALNQCFI